MTFVPLTRPEPSSRPEQILPSATRPVDPTLVRITQVEPPGETIIAGWEPPDMGRYDGDPRWDVYTRPGRVDGQEYRGQELHTRSIELLFNGWGRGRRGLPPTDPDAHRSVERQCSIVHAWSLPVGGHRSGNWPPRLRIEWGPWQQMLWRIDRIRWGRPVFIAGKRVRQTVVLHLVEWTDPTYALSPIEQAAEAATGTAPAAGERTYTVKAGDTLYTIAASQLGDADRWPEIADLNDIRDPYIIHPGQTLKLPAA